MMLRVSQENKVTFSTQQILLSSLIQLPNQLLLLLACEGGARQLPLTARCALKPADSRAHLIDRP